MSKPTAILVGETGLLVECAEVLREHSFTISAVVTTDENCKAWANANGSVSCASFAELPVAAVDFLFSIVNRRILSPQVVALARRLAINYHDSPLPAYGGVHATSWAIYDGAAEHGITWHVMEAAVDTGDILKQVRFPVSDSETALSLNLKCYRAAVDALRELAGELAEGRESRSPQVGEQSYFGRHRKLPGGGYLDWSRPAAETERLWRALEMGPVQNQLGSAKVLSGGKSYLVRALSNVDGRIDIRAVADLDGTSTELPASFTVLSPDDLVRAEALCTEASVDESFWVRRIQALRPTGNFASAKFPPSVSLRAILHAAPGPAWSPRERDDPFGFALPYLLSDSEGRAFPPGDLAFRYPQLRGYCAPLLPRVVETPAGFEMQTAQPHLMQWLAALPRADEESLPLRLAASDKVAISDECGGRLTYAELLHTAALLAGLLYAKGVREGSVGGILLERTVLLPAAVLAIWKLGAAWVPLDPAFPRARLDFLADDSGLSFILTERSLAGRITAPLEIFVEDRGSDPGPAAEVTATLANYLYTSGSTGQPKAAGVTHAGLLNLFEAMSREMDLSSSETLLAVTSFSFDAATLDLFLPLYLGGQVFIASRETAVDGKRLARVIESAEATVLIATPSTFRLLLEAEWQGSSRLKILSGGEVVPRALADALLSRTRAVWNGYGQAETAVCAVISRMVAGHASIPIGHPIQNVRACVQEDGELWLGGACVSSGYRNRPELNEAKFTSDGWFRTGDRVGVRPDGGLEFLDRTGNMVKIRGNRVELGEVEAALLSLDTVQHAAVTAEGDRLVAHVVATVSPGELRRALALLLPDYMVPSLFVPLGAMPLTPTGKVDRQALIMTSLTEQAVVSIFSEVLGNDAIGVNDDFFLSGGHSLLVTRVLARVRDKWQVELPARVLFENVTAAALASRIDETTGLAAVTPDNRPGLLSSGQRRIWFLDRLHAGQRPRYAIPATIRLTGNIDRAALRRAFNEVIARHETLRTNFVEENGEPVAVITPRRKLEFSHESLTELSRPFDLAEGPLIRVALEQREHGVSELRMVVHHIIADALSFHVLLHEVNEIYAGKTLPPLGATYSAYARQERANETAGHLDYWRGQLAGVPPVLEFTDTRPAVRTDRSGYFPFPVPDVTDFSRAVGVTPFVTFLTAFQVLLFRHTVQPDFCVGTHIANRNRQEWEALIGFFVSTLPLRARLSGDLPFSEVLAHARQTVLDALSHQDAPFDAIVEAVRPARDSSYTPLFQVDLVVQDNAATLNLPGVSAAPLRLEPGAAKFDLTLNIEGANASFEYSEDLFDGPAIGRMAGHFQTLLHAAMVSPETPIEALPLLTEAELSRFVVWNRTEKRYSDLLLPELLTRQARLTPAAEALRFENVSVTYEELHRRADAVARQLVARGAGPGVLIGVRMQRSLEMVIALVAIWRAGAAYLPLDPDTPASRMQTILDDARPLLVLRSLEVCDPEFAVPAGDADLAYVIYTSGSTGMPKGVANTNSGIANRILWMQDRYPIGPGDRVLQKTPFTFDVSVWEFFWPLITGACLVIARPEGHREPTYLTALIAKEGVTTVHFVPSMLNAFLEAPRVENCVSLRRVFASGEALAVETVNRFFAKLKAELHNLYGPTEAAVDVTAYACFAQDESTPIPIGKPIANLRTYILNSALEPVPIGVAGELHLAGAGLARGYWNHPELTREKFVEHGGERLYKTGDAARFRPDGNIEFLGRLDNQIKLRGFRIELGEIESTLRQHPWVQEAAVLLQGEQLVAWLVVTPVVTPVETLVAAPVGQPAPAIGQFLRERLPSYMIPSVFEYLPALPLTPSGKVDRKALPAYVPAVEAVHKGPADALEEQLFGIWAEVLGRQPASANSSFFEMGGHSLQAVRLLSRVEAETGVAVPLAALFASPTLAQMAAYLRERRAPGTGVAAIQPLGSRLPVFLVEANSAFWKFGQLLGLDRPLYGLQWPGVEMLTSPYTIEQIAAAQVAMLRSCQPRGPYVIGGWCISAIVAWEIAQQLQAAGERVDLVMLFDGNNPGPSLDAPLPKKLAMWARSTRAAALFHFRHWRNLAGRERRAYVAGRLRTLSGYIRRWAGHYWRQTSAVAGKDMSQIVLEAAVRYRAKPYSGRVAYFRRGHVPDSGYFEPDFGWGRLMDRPLEVYLTGGRHKEMWHSPNVEAMAAVVRELLGPR